MDVSDLSEAVEDMRGHVEARDWPELREEAAACCEATAEMLRRRVGRARGPAAAVAEHARLDAAVLDLRAAVQDVHAAQPAGAGLPGGFDPQTLMTIVELVAKIVDLFKHHGS